MQRHQQSMECRRQRKIRIQKVQFECQRTSNFGKSCFYRRNHHRRLVAQCIVTPQQAEQRDSSSAPNFVHGFTATSQVARLATDFEFDLLTFPSLNS